MKPYKYNSYILPIMDYGCMIWGRCTKQNTFRILKLQKRAARIILNADITTPSKTLFSELNWLAFPQIVQYHTCTMVYKALNGLASEYISNVYRSLVLTIYVLSKNRKNITFFHLKITFFTDVKKCCLLHGRVFVIFLAPPFLQRTILHFNSSL